MTSTQQSGPATYDYIIVGSGAGGGPLAARLALAGHRVLVIEAGSDHLAEDAAAAEVSLVPGFHGLASEHPDLSWRFFVRHYTSPPAGADPKNHPQERDTEPKPHGIFYPRSSGIGGCTVHNAMITIAGPDSDWEDLADQVGDDSWRSGPMRAYFTKLERNEYRPVPRRPPTRWFGRLLDQVKWLFGFDPDHAGGKHGFDGWLHTSVTDFTLGLGDRQLKKVLAGALWQAFRDGLDRAWAWTGLFLRGQVLRLLDPNHARTQAESPEGVVSVPLAVHGKRTTIHQNSETPFVMRGRRSSPREFLNQVRAAHPDRLTIWTDTLVTRVLFDDGAERPRAVGVSFLRGRHLYKAHPEPSEDSGKAGKEFVKPDGEVILCGGAFNTPQLLMLSGLGPAKHMAEIAGKDKEACTLWGREGPLPGTRRIHLPGVGKNLQDRYEVTLITEMRKDFKLLDGATFVQPGSGNKADRHLLEWRNDGTGLYTSNGAVLGIFKRSQPDLEQPDLFIFGIPLPFKGYDVGYSKAGHIHNRFTWAILKGHTRNTDGTVRLRSTDPRETPDINFHYFNETSCRDKSGQDPDLKALVEGVKFVRGIEKRTFWFRTVPEEHPGPGVPDEDDDRIKDWIRREAWGHHACGTCRMGPAGDIFAVLDSRFRVREVDGLRVVDASIFPRIPGYFIVTNLYMASEKAADVIHEDRQFKAAQSPVYPRELRAREAAAIGRRRKAVDKESEFPPAGTAEDGWPADVAGLALSGGGVRSATFNLGILQALAERRWLRRMDLLSTVSGGGYIGTFLGRWFDRLRPGAVWGGEGNRQWLPPADRIERELNEAASPAIAWLRRNANYIAPSGEGEARYNVAVFLRNFLSVHVTIGLLLFTLFGLANVVRYGFLDPATAAFDLLGMSTSDFPIGRLLEALLGVFFSPWFIAFELVVLFMVVPQILAFWIVSQDRFGRFEPVPLAAMLIVSALILFVSVRETFNLPMLFVGLSLLTSLVHIELAWHKGRDREAAIGRGGVETQRLRTRNILTYDLGLTLALAGGMLAFALIDTIGHGLQQAAAANQVYLQAFAGFLGAVMSLAPVVRFIANRLAGEKGGGSPSALLRVFRAQITAALMAAVLVTVPLVFVSFTAHAVFDGGESATVGAYATLVAALLSFTLAWPSGLKFVNRSSLAQTYAARLARAYLGATNPLRYRAQAADVTEVVAGDDVPSIRDYKPHDAGGPLHLINLCVNQTVDFSSQRGNRDRKGENLAVSSIGMTVGQRWHSAWADPPDDELAWQWWRTVRLVPLGHQKGTDHPLVDETGAPADRPEMLSLRQWMGISGAAFGPGAGQLTKFGTALLLGLANVRTGYWWNSGIDEASRDGFPDLSFLRRVGYFLRFLFQTQALLLSEWIARFPGPWDRYWYLSDGGHFEVLGAYELIRRRVPRIIVCDGSADPGYNMESFANLVRKARIDFDADIVPFAEADYEAARIPDAVQQRLGSLTDLKARVARKKTQSAPPYPPVAARHAALFWVRHRTGPKSVLLYLKANLTGDESADVLQYRATHPDFPHEPTEDQFFDEEQWESYRWLGKHMMSALCPEDAPDWFWTIPLEGE